MLGSTKSLFRSGHISVTLQAGALQKDKISRHPSLLCKAYLFRERKVKDWDWNFGETNPIEGHFSQWKGRFNLLKFQSIEEDLYVQCP